MKIISHRGNLEGPDLLKENHPDQIKKVLDLGFDVEIDVWEKEHKFLLGHDSPVYEVFIWESFFEKRIWVHCKNLRILDFLVRHNCYSDGNFFWHQNDDFTLTNNNYIWTYPGKELTKNSILVLPEQNNIKYKDIKDKGIYGVCTDYPLKWKEDIG